MEAGVSQAVSWVPIGVVVSQARASTTAVKAASSQRETGS